MVGKHRTHKAMNGQRQPHAVHAVVRAPDTRCATQQPQHLHVRTLPVLSRAAMLCCLCGWRQQHYRSGSRAARWAPTACNSFENTTIPPVARATMAPLSQRSRRSTRTTRSSNDACNVVGNNTLPVVAGATMAATTTYKPQHRTSYN